jgi:HK97 family phage major capsid protein
MPKPEMPGIPTEEQRAAMLETALTEIRTLAATHTVSDIGEAFIRAEIGSGRVPSIAAFRGVVRSELPESTPLRNEAIGMTGGETRQFSLMKLIRSMAPDATKAHADAASFEIEACNAAADNAERAGTGMYRLPAEVMNSWGDFQVDGARSTDPRVRSTIMTSGNPNVLTTLLLTGQFIENLRNASALMSAGVTTLTGLSSDVDIPGADTNSQAYWLASEDADAADTYPTFRKIGLSPKDLAAKTDISRRMMQQSSLGIEAYVRSELLKAMALEIDRAGMYGDGSTGKPTGVSHTTGIGSVTFAAANPTRDEIINMRTAIAQTNIGRGVTFIGNSAFVGYAQKTPVQAGYPVFLMGDTADTLVGNGYIESNQITTGDLFAGVWSDVLMGTWGSLELDRSTEAKFLSGGLRLRAIQTVDFGVRRVGSLVYGKH